MPVSWPWTSWLKRKGPERLQHIRPNSGGCATAGGDQGAQITDYLTLVLLGGVPVKRVVVVTHTLAPGKERQADQQRTKDDGGGADGYGDHVVALSK